MEEKNALLKDLHQARMDRQRHAAEAAAFSVPSSAAAAAAAPKLKDVSAKKRKHVEADADAALARTLQAEESAAASSQADVRRAQEEADARYARSLTAGSSPSSSSSSLRTQEESDARLARLLMSTGSSASASSSASSSAAASNGGTPWPSHVVWQEAQHEIGKCGNFDVCSKGSSFFYCNAMDESTAHGVEPVPLPGQTITIKRMSQLRLGPSNRYPAKRPITLNGATTVKTATSQSYTPFKMGSFEGKVETIVLNGSGERVYILRNFDGVHGRRLARSLEGAYGVDVLAGKGTNAKCAAAQGNNCQDDYKKVYPPRMYLDDRMSNIMRPLLDGAIDAVNASIHLPPASASSSSAAASQEPLLSLRRGERASAGTYSYVSFRAFPVFPALSPGCASLRACALSQISTDI